MVGSSSGRCPACAGLVAAACNAHGVSGSAGLAEHVLDGLGLDRRRTSARQPGAVHAAD
jgi:hypothetical protein